jgi:hypothetical protein
MKCNAQTYLNYSTISDEKEAVNYVFRKKCAQCQQPCNVKQQHSETQGCLLYCTANNSQNPKWIIAFSNPNIGNLTVTPGAV